MYFYGGQLGEVYPRDSGFKLVVFIVVIDVCTMRTHIRTIDISFMDVQN